ncbi:Multiple inositol polyphosphate phosphatase 1 [Dissostichus eleginoides]|uniref:Multiple inositol polyphosphate phosphatase 1 n=1 Tax=Dissostichus eleginoides TaxID=100907 RepID=A0AAD9FKK7_DISEL|nr:Multiple inositol polyphosphate phosphatase 1 [Dissostichus eleginoides]
MQQLYNMVLHNATGEESWLREIQSQWRMWYTEDMDGRLVQKGVEELKHLAIRLSKLFPSLISEDKLRGGYIKFITSSKHRCVNSTLSFKAGLTELWAITDQDFDHAINDSVMRFFDHCTRYVQEVDNNSSALSEINKFRQGPEMRRVTEKIANRLGVQYSLITQDMADAAFYLCAYEFTIKAVNSPWCQLFDEEDAKVIEYASDLREYWKRGYGYDINSKSSCILFHDVFNRLNKAASENKSGQQVTEAVTVQVGHADTLLPLLTLLGFFKDNVSLNSSAAQREPVTFPELSDQQASMPRYEDVKENYSELLQGCDFETECQLFKSPA